jgi:hypothetical protein
MRNKGRIHNSKYIYRLYIRIYLSIGATHGTAGNAKKTDIRINNTPCLRGHWSSRKG